MKQLWLKKLLQIGALMLLCNFASAQSSQNQVTLDIAVQPMEQALNDFARQTGLQLLFRAEEVSTQLTAPSIAGSFTPQAALDRLLANSPLAYEFINARTVAIRLKTTDAVSARPAAMQFQSTDSLRLAKVNQEAQPEPLPQQSAADRHEAEQKKAAEEGEVLVTGTHIKGVAPAGSPVLVIDEESIRRSGYTSTEQLIQSLPQNVRGGAEGATADSEMSSGSLAGLNSTRGTGANLRGLGSTATLTLINGRRLAASGSGTFTDISLIPLSAIERIEVLTDGASAIYGADAVAGVINVILKSNYSGAETRARYGMTTESGRDEVRLSQTLGSSWGSGNGLMVLDYLTQSELLTSERDFTSNVRRPTSIYPDNKQLGFVFSGTQQFGDKWSAQGDAQFTRAKRYAVLTYSSGMYQAPVDLDRTNVAMSLVYRPFSDWDFSLDGIMSKEEVDFSFITYPAGSSTPSAAESSYQNQYEEQNSIGLKASGSLFRVPAGSVGLALGVAHRNEDYNREVPLWNFTEPAHRKVDSAFAEIHIPFFGGANARSGLQRLDVSLAGRYDDYSDFGDTFNPKVGISWSPVPSLEFRSSYSTSFRAPAAGRELRDSQVGTRNQVPIYSFVAPNGVGRVPLFGLSGSQILVAEESDNWTAGLTYKPEFLAGMEVSFTYYDISYTNRIISPPFDFGALSDPALQTFVRSFATAAEAQAAVAALVGGNPIYTDYTGPTYSGGEFGPNPQNIATYIYDTRFTNAGLVDTSGFDFTVDYTFDLAEDRLKLALNVNHIAEINTVFAPGAPSFDFAGTTGNPVNWRFRATSAYSRGNFDTALAVNYTDSYTDTSGAIDAGVRAYVTVDANLRYTLDHPTSSALRDLSFALSLTNLLDEAPPYVSLSGRNSNYDSSNADPLGRMVSFEVAKRW